ncbi:hypothetical protein [Burkholderia stagnalis]|uniref:hypothetical protein n=1 Tax=Burkholderia stagnalis TaxID=1503054 RepID=UPI000F579D14|nr:hypothetical protein [Burkholderia stagnalis]RQQ65548.1 hypothetical protein DF137_22465 [Burkholderia stagnalis]RQQ78182.1 hypothetical protein DF138_21760 [Burkholderia stagnalis]RQQ87785.1 hypothetical protein DF136_21430 [Burkholderia stagnalis]
MDGIFDPSAYGVGDNTYGFSVGPQSDGTYNVPATAIPVTGSDTGGAGYNYAPGVFTLLNNGLSAFTNIYQQGQMLDYKRYEATQAGLVAQGNAAATVASAQIGAVQSNKMLMILGVFAVVLLAVHKG